MIAWLRRRWHARLRRIDEDILWPSVRDAAMNIEQARDAFARHCAGDVAWDEFTPEEIFARVEALK